MSVVAAIERCQFGPRGGAGPALSGRVFLLQEVAPEGGFHGAVQPD